MRHDFGIITFRNSLFSLPYSIADLAEIGTLLCLCNKLILSFSLLKLLSKNNKMKNNKLTKHIVNIQKKLDD